MTYKPVTSSGIVIQGMRFLQELQKHYGKEKGMAVWDSMREAMGDDVAGDILFGTMANYSSSIQYHGWREGKQVSVVKTIRQFTNLGLKDAMALAKGPCTIDITMLSNKYQTREGLETFREYLGNMGADVD
jgi:ribosomal protein L7/L12